MLEENSQIYSVRIYASSGTFPGREGPLGVADQKTWNGQHLLAAFFCVPLWQRGIEGDFQSSNPPLPPFSKLIVSHKSSAGHRETGYNWFN